MRSSASQLGLTTAMTASDAKRSCIGLVSLSVCLSRNTMLKLIRNTVVLTRPAYVSFRVPGKLFFQMSTVKDDLMYNGRSIHVYINDAVYVDANCCDEYEYSFCLYVCLSARITRKSHRRTFTTCFLWPLLTRTLNGLALRYLLPVLRMTSRTTCELASCEHSGRASQRR